ncbi:MAG: class I SAM-dependent methyltransferase [Thermoleophilia bacterium]|nr:class I SAM-dependent methyltransferase [Thermoleophilia bacterium]
MRTTDRPQELDHIAQNKAWWKRSADSYQLRHAEQLPTSDPTWGVFSTPESELQVLGEVAGRDVAEFGAGGAQFSLGLARRGARCTAIDFSEEQLAHARRLIARVAAEDDTPPAVTLVHADVEATGLPDASFDVAFSDYGASMFADPYRWIPEAARVLRPGGRLAFSLITPMLETCWEGGGAEIDGRLAKDYFGMHRIEDDGMVMFNLPYGEWIRLFRSCGLSIVDLVETQPPVDTAETTYRSRVQVEWSRRWPAEMIWVLDRDR